MNYIEVLENLLNLFVNLAILLFEYIGVAVITYSGLQGVVNYVRRRSDTRLVLAKGLAMGLEFKLGSEILRTVIVRSMSEIYIVASIVALRAILTILIHWEIKNEEKEKIEAAEMAQKEISGSGQPIPSATQHESDKNLTEDSSSDESRPVREDASFFEKTMPSERSDPEATDNAPENDAFQDMTADTKVSGFADNNNGSDEAELHDMNTDSEASVSGSNGCDPDEADSREENANSDGSGSNGYDPDKADSREENADSEVSASGSNGYDPDEADSLDENANSDGSGSGDNGYASAEAISLDENADSEPSVSGKSLIRSEDPAFRDNTAIPGNLNVDETDARSEKDDAFREPIQEYPKVIRPVNPGAPIPNTKPRVPGSFTK